MIRCRFKANEDDCRPIKVPYPHPWWCTGGGDGFSVVVAYADNEDQILQFWPEAEDLDSEEREEYTFTSRFPQPDDWVPPEGAKIKVIA